MRKLFLIPFLFCFPSIHSSAEPLPGTQAIQLQGDFAEQMVSGIDRYLMNAIEENTRMREQKWEVDTSSEAAFLHSIQPKRELLRQRLALADQRDPANMQWVGEVNPFQADRLQSNAALVSEHDRFSVYEISWHVFRHVSGAGLLLVPKEKISAAAVALPDADQTAEEIAGLLHDDSGHMRYAKQLAERNCLVIVPTSINRKDTYSGISGVRMTNQPHREYLWRAAYEMGRTVIGYEMQIVLAVVDWFEVTFPDLPIGIAGYGEGGLLALYSAAVDERIGAALVSGYFQSGEQLWKMPIDRNVWSLRKDFGEAEIAALVYPRTLIIEASPFPNYNGSPQTPHRSGAAPGSLVTPAFQSVKSEFDRISKITPGKNNSQLFEEPSTPMGNASLSSFLTALGLEPNPNPEPSDVHTIRSMNPEQRHKEQFMQILEDTQYLMRESEFTREEFWADADHASEEAWVESTQNYKNYFWENIIGKLPKPDMPIHPRSTKIYDEPTFTGYRVVLDVYPDVFAYGILLIPKNMRDNERRPVVVCQHGLEGRPRDVADPAINSHFYHQFACQLAEEGFVTFSPQNPYIGEDKFRVLLRKGQPIGLTLFSFIVRQHERILEWLSQQPFVDPDRMAFYGLSYGGKTAMRVPPLLDGYCLSICSGDFNEWIWKNVSSRHRYSYLLTGEYDMPEFNIGNTFNYAEMSWMIFPRPFMVERGQLDGVAPSKWVAYEFARTRQLYDEMGEGERTEIEFFQGTHTINGKGTFAFLRKYLDWPPE